MFLPIFGKVCHGPLSLHCHDSSQRLVAVTRVDPCSSSAQREFGVAGLILLHGSPKKMGWEYDPGLDVYVTNAPSASAGS